MCKQHKKQSLVKKAKILLTQRIFTVENVKASISYLFFFVSFKIRYYSNFSCSSFINKLGSLMIRQV